MSRAVRFLFAAALLASGCDGPVPPQSVSANRLRRLPADHELAATVHASFYPLAFFAEELVRGTELRVICPVPPGEDPAYWEPTRAEARAMRDGPLTFVHGASFERWPGYTVLSPARTVVAADGMRDALRPYDEGATHTHGPPRSPSTGLAESSEPSARGGSGGSGGSGVSEPSTELVHRGIDAHTWLAPDLAQREAEIVLSGLQRAFPAHAERFAANHAALGPSFEAWRRSVEATTRALSGARLVANHPAYEYLAHGHGWHIDNVDLDPEELPDATALEELSALAGAGARLLLWESQPAPDVERAVAASGLRSVVFSPCETLDEDQRATGATFFTIMLANLERLRSALPTDPK